MQEVLGKWLFDPTMGKVVAALIGLAVIYALVRVLQRSIGRYVLDSDTRYQARKVASLLGYVTAFGLLGAVFSERLAGLTVAFGVAGAGVAFALQEVIASIAGWVAISFGNFFSPGDRVQLGGIRGDVIDVGVLRTTLMELGQWVDADLYNGRIVRIANSFVFKEPVFNYSADFPFLWDEITLPIRYGSDWELARRTFRGVVNEVVATYAVESREAWKAVVERYLIEAAGIDPMITIRATDNWIEFTARYIVDYKKRRFTKDRLFTRMLEEIDKSENRIRLASATFELVPGSTIDVQWSRKAAAPAA